MEGLTSVVSSAHVLMLVSRKLRAGLLGCCHLDRFFSTTLFRLMANLSQYAMMFARCLLVV
ncbi:hypothetical protein LINPERHAP1_LOCUS2943 [Linum perenne]